MATAPLTLHLCCLGRSLCKTLFLNPSPAALGSSPHVTFRGKFRRRISLSRRFSRRRRRLRFASHRRRLSQSQCFRQTKKLLPRSLSRDRYPIISFLSFHYYYYFACDCWPGSRWLWIWNVFYARILYLMERCGYLLDSFRIAWNMPHCQMQSWNLAMENLARI